MSRLQRTRFVHWLAAGCVLATLVACGSDFERVIEGDIAVNVESISIPQTAIGRTYNTQFALSNTGDGDLTITDIQIVGSSGYIQFSPGFITSMDIENGWRAAQGGQTWSERPPVSVRSDGSIQVDIEFTPIDTNIGCPGTGPCGTIVITSDDRDEPSLVLNIELSQGAGQIVVEPTVLSFPAITGGPYTENFTIGNRGSGPLTIASVDAGNLEGLTLTETSNRPPNYTLQVGDQALYAVTFTPRAGTDYCPGGIDGCALTSIQIDSDDVNGNNVIVSVVIGGGGQPDVTLSTNFIEYNVESGSSETKTVDVINQGDANLNWSVRVDPTALREFFTLTVNGSEVINPQQTALSPEGRQTVEITYNAPDDRTDVAEFVINSNDPDQSTLRLPLYIGDPAPEIGVDPSRLVFTGVAAGASGSLDMVIRNIGRATLTITSGIVTNTAFTVPDLTNVAIGPGQSYPVTVTYTRAEDVVAASVNGEITIESNSLSNGTYHFMLQALHDETYLPPTAVLDATPAEPYSVNQTITLSAANSTAPDNAVGSLSYEWSITGAPGSSTATFSSDFGESVTFEPDFVGTYSILVTVSAPINATTTTVGQATRNLFVQ